ncbi:MULTISPECIES: DUF3618 domain-containing protein [unclassified Aureimonas]|uniref:DUF3618 domain-containing protein n=1 Tax=unclassified Aureimonas TaxID=2615206 RepID=UPI0006F4C089|nr:MULTISPECIES: DUF3618 domain-containing protein [unclassified Aureimonas]KQT64412.1 hypothetical protein ASG62_05450 [Aureimonas sp. Leaf427]KQT81602.1 hypothetical protein ASG54_02730 [Aureimonas sp. Leaf460]
MSLETDKLEREVENRRSSVESTIDALRNRMSVGQIFDEVQGYMKEGQITELSQNLGRQVRDNPLALGLVGAGIAWLLMGDGVRGAGRRVADRFESDDPAPYPDYASVAGRRERYAEPAPYRVGGASGSIGRSAYPDRDRDGPGLVDRAKDAVMGAAESVADTLSSGASSASSGVSSAAGSLRDGASSLGDTARAYGHDAADAAWRAEQAAVDRARWAADEARRLGSRARRTFLDTLQDEPLVIGAVALAIGAAIGASLPSTRIEDEYLGDARDNLRDQAYDYGKGAVESARHVAEETVRAAGEEADAKGLKPTGEGETFAEKVSGVVRTAAETAKSEAKKEGLV